MRRLVSTFFLLLCLLSAYGQEEQNTVIQSDTVLIKDFNLLFLPLVFYTPETEFGFGGGAQGFFRTRGSDADSKLSNFFASVIYTTRKQLIIDLKPQVYFGNESYYLDSWIKYKVYPNSFWGIGRNTPESNEEQYNMRSFEFKAALLKSMPPFLSFGFEYFYNYYEMIEVVEGGLLDTENIEGANGATTTGLAMVFNIDHRDNNFAPQQGSYIRVDAGFSSKAMGASHSYNKYKIDYRKYIPVTPRNLIALQAYFEYTYGEVPFQSAAWYGGGERARGYFRGRFIDNHMYVLQAEWRARILPRWTLAGFFTSGDVMENPGDSFRAVKLSYGGGIRFQVKKDIESVLRLDIGFNEFGDSGIYFGVNEAF